MDNSDISHGDVTSSPCSPIILLGTSVVFFVVVLFVYKYSSNDKRFDRKRDELIHFCKLPSPIGYPIVGHLTRVGALPHIVLTEWSKRYGPMFRIKMGSQDVLVVSGTDNIKKALVTKSQEFAGRPNLETSKLISEGLSLTFSNYNSMWNHQKVAAKAAVSLYTTGKDPTKRSVMEESTSKHANNLVDQLIQHAEKQDGILNPRDLILTNASNSICEVCFGQKFDFDDPKLRELLSINRNFDEAMASAQPVNFFPMLKHVPIVSQSFKNLEIYAGRYWRFVTSMLKSHWNTYDGEEMRDLVDCLYNESEKQRRNNNDVPIGWQNGVSNQSNGKLIECNGRNCHNGFASANGFNHNTQDKESCYDTNGRPDAMMNPLAVEDRESEQELKKRITYTAGDIFGAGYDTTFTMIHWAFLYLAVYPEAQRKIRNEIDEVISPSEQPSYRLHVSKCPYTMAWIYEMLRHCTPSPLLVPHSTTQEVTLNNCVIPAGVTVYFNAWEAHKDPKIWDDPEVFSPERFLTEKEDGSLSLKQNSTTKMFTWGAGKRQCLGQHLSRHQLFIFISTIVRRLYINPSRPGVEPVLPWPVTFGLTLKPHPFNVKIEERTLTVTT